MSVTVHDCTMIGIDRNYQYSIIGQCRYITFLKMLNTDEVGHNASSVV